MPAIIEFDNSFNCLLLSYTCGADYQVVYQCQLPMKDIHPPNNYNYDCLPLKLCHKLWPQFLECLRFNNRIAVTV